MIEIYDRWRILNANMSNLLVSTVTVDVDHLPSFTDIEMLYALLPFVRGIHQSLVWPFVRGINQSLVWPFVRGIHQSLVDSPDKGPVTLTSMFSSMLAWTNCWINSQVASDLRRCAIHVMPLKLILFISSLSKVCLLKMHLAFTWKTMIKSGDNFTLDMLCKIVTWSDHKIRIRTKIFFYKITIMTS